MKLDLSTTFLNGEEDLTAAVAPQSRSQRWGRRAVLVAILLPVVGYLALVASALLDQFRPTISPIQAGWFRISDRERKFQVDLPASPSLKNNSSNVEYHANIALQYSVVVRSYSVARELLNKTATKVLQETAVTYGNQDPFTVFDSGPLDSNMQWIESKSVVGGGPEQYAIRRRLLIHNKQLLEVTVFGPEADVMSPDATRIMKSAQWLNR